MFLARSSVFLLLLAESSVTPWKVGSAAQVARRTTRDPAPTASERRDSVSGGGAPLPRRSRHRASPKVHLKLPDEEDIDAFLDTPFYDPDKVLEDESSSEPSKRFARFVKGDYETAEAVLSGAFFFVMVVVSQELLRMHLHGPSYVPFAPGGAGPGGGMLF
jgi:hypothetical protein